MRSYGMGGREGGGEGGREGERVRGCVILRYVYCASGDNYM